MFYYLTTYSRLQRKTNKKVERTKRFIIDNELKITNL